MSTGALAGSGAVMKSPHCACTICATNRHRAVITASAQGRGVVELFMVNNFDDGKKDKK